MSDITPIGQVNGAAALGGGRRTTPPQPVDTQTSRQSDQVELSIRAQLLSKLADLPDVRQELIDRVRQQIEAGDYDTPDKVDALLEELAADIDSA